MSEPFEGEGGWAIIELMGHVRIAGHLSEAKIAGAQVMRLDIYRAEGPAALTQFIPPPAPGGSVYRITPATEAICRALGERSVPVPVARFELEPPGPPAPRTIYDEDCDEAPL